MGRCLSPGDGAKLGGAVGRGWGVGACCLSEGVHGVVVAGFGQIGVVLVDFVAIGLLLRF